jgi:hypothetical protein
VELGQGVDTLADLFRDSRDSETRNLDHVFGDIDARDPISAAGQKLAHPTRPTANIEYLRTHAEAELVNDMRERAQTRRELEVRRGAERFSSQPQTLAFGQAFDVLAMAAIEVVAEAFEAPVTGAPKAAELPHGLLCG